MKLKKIISLCIIICYLLNNIAGATGVYNGRLLRGKACLSPPLLCGPLGENTRHHKFLAQAKIGLQMKLKVIDNLTDIDGVTDIEDIKYAFARYRKQQEFTFLENADIDPAYVSVYDVEAFEHRSEKVRQLGDNVFAIHVSVETSKERKFYRLLFSTIRDHNQIFPVVFIPEEELNVRIIEGIKAENVIPRLRVEDIEVIDDYIEHETNVDTFFAQKTQNSDSHIICSESMKIDLLFGYLPFVDLEKELEGLGIETHRRQIMDEVKERKLIFVHANDKDLPIIHMKDEKGKRHEVKVDSHSSNSTIWIALNSEEWEQFKKVEQELRQTVVPANPHVTLKGETENFICKFRNKLLYEVGAFCGLNGVAVYKFVAGRAMTASNDISKLMKLIAIASSVKEWDERDSIKALLKDIQPVDLDLLLGVNALGESYIRDYAGTSDEQDDSVKSENDDDPDDDGIEWRLVVFDSTPAGEDIVPLSPEELESSLSLPSAGELNLPALPSKMEEAIIQAARGGAECLIPFIMRNTTLVEALKDTGLWLKDTELRDTLKSIAFGEGFETVAEEVRAFVKTILLCDPDSAATFVVARALMNRRADPEKVEQFMALANEILFDAGCRDLAVNLKGLLDEDPQTQYQSFQWLFMRLVKEMQRCKTDEAIKQDISV